MFRSIPCDTIIAVCMILVTINIIFGAANRFLGNLREERKIPEKQCRVMEALIMPIRGIAYLMLGVFALINIWTPIMISTVVLCLFGLLMVGTTIRCVVELRRDFNAFVNSTNDNTAKSDYATDLFLVVVMTGASFIFLMTTFGPWNPYL